MLRDSHAIHTKLFPACDPELMMSGPSSNFSAFLQARVSNSYANSPRLSQTHQQQLRLFHQPSIRTMATQEDRDVYGFETPDTTYGKDSYTSAHDTQAFAPAPHMPTNRMQTFEELSRNDTSVVSALTNVSQWQEIQQASQGRLPFRPLLPVPVDTSIANSSHNSFRSDDMSLGGSFDSMNTSFVGSIDGAYDGANTSFGGTNSMQPLKIDTSVAAATPSLSILSTPVDPTQYEIVHDAEWVWSSTDYASSTRSSIRTESTGPRTPLSPHTAESHQSSSYFSSHYQESPHMGVPKLGGAGSDMFPSTLPRPFLMNCPCADCTVPGAPHQMSGSWTIGQPQMSFSGSLPTYGSDVSSTACLPAGFSNSSQTFTGPFVPRQSSPPTTSSLMDLERQSSETTEGESEDSESELEEPNVNDQAINDATHRQKRDSFLLNMRRQNYSYKDIKELGNFREAESTLRGRVRVLTKDKSERVRKPEWDSNDISLLNRAFERYAGFDDDDEAKPRRRELPSRIPWKKISGWMKSHGSSYPFAPATCARKWKALN